MTDGRWPLCDKNQGPDKRGGGGKCPGTALFGGAALLVKRRFNKWSFTDEPQVRLWLRLDLPYVPVSKVYRNFTSVKFSKLTPA